MSVPGFAEVAQSWWDADRLEILRLLSGLDGSIASMYKLAIDLMAEPPAPGQELARLSSVGHCIREILNNLPEALNDVAGAPDRGNDRGESARRLSFVILNTFPSSNVAFSNSNASEDDDEVRNVSVPAAVVEAMTKFANEHQEVAKRVARRDSASVLGWIDPTNPALVPWTAARGFFMRRTHLNLGQATKPASPLPSDADVIIHIENIEASLRARLGAFYDTIHSLDDLLEEANRQHAVADGGSDDRSDSRV